MCESVVEQKGIKGSMGGGGAGKVFEKEFRRERQGQNLSKIEEKVTKGI